MLLPQVPHLVIVETDKMFHLQRMRQYYQQLVREPITVQHGPAASAHHQAYQQTLIDMEAAYMQQLQQHRQNKQLLGEQAAALLQQKGAGSFSNSSSTTNSITSRAVYSAQAQLLETSIPEPQPPLPPLQSVFVRPHMQEHMQPLPKGAATRYKSNKKHAGPSHAEVLRELTIKRAKAVQQYGIYSPAVQAMNRKIMAVKHLRYEQESSHRQSVLLTREIVGEPKVMPKAPTGGRGSRRGMMAEARAALAAKAAQRAALAGSGSSSGSLDSSSGSSGGRSIGGSTSGGSSGGAGSRSGGGGGSGDRQSRGRSSRSSGHAQWEGGGAGSTGAGAGTS